MDNFEIWEKVEDWFDNQILYKWEHCYATFDLEGKLIRVQSSGRDWCQGAHYLQSGHYSWSGKTKLAWSYDEETKKGYLKFPNGRVAKRWVGYLAVILFRTKNSYDHKKEKWERIWDRMSLPELLFKRSRASKSRYEHGGRLFSDSLFVQKDETNHINVPEEFYHLAYIYFESLLQYIRSDLQLQFRKDDC